MTRPDQPSGNAAHRGRIVITGAAGFVGSHLVRGYAEQIPLDDAELGALFGLVALRLCMSACIAAEQQRARPDNDYLGVS